jgi:hypothetical protein
MAIKRAAAARIVEDDPVLVLVGGAPGARQGMSSVANVNVAAVVRSALRELAVVRASGAVLARIARQAERPTYLCCGLSASGGDADGSVVSSIHRERLQRSDGQARRSASNTLRAAPLLATFILNINSLPFAAARGRRGLRNLFARGALNPLVTGLLFRSDKECFATLLTV